MENERKEIAEDIPFTKEEVRDNLMQFYKVCNEIFSDKEKYKDLFYTNEEIEYLKNHPEKCRELNIKFI